MICYLVWSILHAAVSASRSESPPVSIGTTLPSSTTCRDATAAIRSTTQRNAEGIEDAQRRSVQLQYVLSFGAHGAHTF